MSASPFRSHMTGIIITASSIRNEWRIVVIVRLSRIFEIRGEYNKSEKATKTPSRFCNELFIYKSHNLFLGRYRGLCAWPGYRQRRSCKLKGLFRFQSLRASRRISTDEGISCRRGIHGCDTESRNGETLTLGIPIEAPARQG